MLNVVLDFMLIIFLEKTNTAIEWRGVTWT